MKLLKPLLFLFIAAVTVVPLAAAQTKAATVATLAPPSQAGPWRQVGAALTSRPGKALHFYRIPQNPKAVGIVATSMSARPIQLFWAIYCEFESDDAMTEDWQGTLTGVHSVVAYPHVMDSATLCYVWVNTRASAGAKISAAVFAY